MDPQKAQQLRRISAITECKVVPLSYNSFKLHDVAGCLQNGAKLCASSVLGSLCAAISPILLMEFPVHRVLQQTKRRCVPLALPENRAHQFHGQFHCKITLRASLETPLGSQETSSTIAICAMTKNLGYRFAYISCVYHLGRFFSGGILTMHHHHHHLHHVITIAGTHRQRGSRGTGR